MAGSDTVIENMPVTFQNTVYTTLDVCRADYATHLYPQKLALTSPTSRGRSVGIVRSRTQATELFIIITTSLDVRYSLSCCVSIML
jgi:hypothetical protein